MIPQYCTAISATVHTGSTVHVNVSLVLFYSSTVGYSKGRPTDWSSRQDVVTTVLFQKYRVVVDYTGIRTILLQQSTSTVFQLLLQSSTIRQQSTVATILQYGVKGRHYCTLQMLAVTMSGRWTTLFNFTVRIPEEPKVHCTVTVILYSTIAVCMIPICLSSNVEFYCITLQYSTIYLTVQYSTVTGTIPHCLIQQ